MEISWSERNAIFSNWQPRNIWDSGVTEFIPVHHMLTAFIGASSTCSNIKQSFDTRSSYARQRDPFSNFQVPNTNRTEFWNPVFRLFGLVSTSSLWHVTFDGSIDWHVSVEDQLYHTVLTLCVLAGQSHVVGHISLGPPAMVHFGMVTFHSPST